MLSVRSDDSGGAEGGQQGIPSDTGKAGVEGRRGIAGVPDGPQRIDEARSPREVECDEFRHCR